MFNILHNGEVVHSGIQSPRFAANLAEAHRRIDGGEWTIDNFPDLEYNEHQVNDIINSWRLNA